MTMQAVAAAQEQAKTALRHALNSLRRDLLSPPVATSLSEWADKNIVLGAISPEPGPWRTDRTPYLKQILDTCGDYRTERVVVMASAQVGKTSVLVNTAGFYISHDPCPIMVVQPDKSMADTFSSTKLSPIIEESPVLRKKVASTRKRDGGSKKLEKVFSGGFISMVSAKSVHSLRSRSIRCLLLDEVDAYDETLGDEGDPVKLAIARTSNYSNRKIIACSTPTLKGFSRIEKEYAASDQRVYEVPCPLCGERQQLEFGSQDAAYGLKWAKDDPTTVAYLCKHCGQSFSEAYKLQMLLNGVWRKRNPTATTAGFHISALYSPWTSWADIAREWREVYALPDKRQSFYNLLLGEPYEDSDNTIEAGDLIANCSVYDAQVPRGVGVLVCGIDVQESWIEAAVWGVGANEEMWLIDVKQIVGETSHQAVWDELAFFLKQPYTTYSGESIPIMLSAIDSGNQTELVFRNVKALRAEKLNVIPVKGFDGARSVFEWSQFKKTGKAHLGIVGSSQAKGILHSRLKTVTKHGAGFIHFPSGVHREVLDQILAERKVVIHRAGMQPKTVWKKLRDRNEQLDAMVYAYAVYLSLGIGFVQQQLPKNIAAWSAEPSGVILPVVGPDGTDSTPQLPVQHVPAGFAKRTTMARPRSLVNKGWLK